MDKTLNALLSSAMARKAALVRDPSPDKFTLALLTSEIVITLVRLML